MIDKFVRKEILDFKPYIPGKPIEEVRRELGIKGEIIKLASNENSLGTPKKIIGCIIRHIKDINRYPDGSSFLLRKIVAKKYNISPDKIIFGSGTDELIELIGKTFFNKLDEIIVSEHAFIRYKMAGELMGCKVISVPMNNFKHDIDSMLNFVTRKTKAIFIANPNNPTGTYNTKNEIRTFLNKLLRKSLNCPPIVVFDEAYYEYATVHKDYPNSLEFHKLYPNLITLRTFSKIYGLAGLRVGYAVSNEKIISYMDRIRPPFNVNLLAQVAVIHSLADNKQHIKKSLEMVEHGKKYLYKQLNKIGLRYLPSAANFILINVSPYRGIDIFNKLLKKGIIVRAMDEYDFPDYIRVTIGKPKENRKFIYYLKKVLDKKL